MCYFMRLVLEHFEFVAPAFGGSLERVMNADADGLEGGEHIAKVAIGRSQTARPHASEFAVDIDDRACGWFPPLDVPCDA